MNKKQIKKIKKLFSITLLIFFISLISLSIINYLNKINHFNIKKIIVEGNDFINDEDIRRIVNDFLENENILNLNLGSLKKSINNNKYIQSNKLYTYLPSTLCIEINEISPRGFYEIKNKIFLLDNMSNNIEADIDAINFYNIPVISSDNEELIDLSKTSTILNNIFNYNNTLFSIINEIQFRDDQKIYIYLNNKTKIKLNSKNITRNLNVLFSFINTTQNSKELSSYKYIDLTINDQVIVKEKKIKIWITNI